METSAHGRSNRRVIGNAAGAALPFSHLYVPRQALVRLWQNINYGSIQALSVKDGEPVFSPPPVVLVDIKLDADDAPRPEVDLPDFELCSEVPRLIGKLHELSTGIVERLEVRAGIPRRIIFRGSLTKAPLPQLDLRTSRRAKTLDRGSGLL